MKRPIIARGSTPTIILELYDELGDPIDMSATEKVRVTFTQNHVRVFTKDSDDDDGVSVETDQHLVTVSLTEAESLRFEARRPADIQVKGLNQGATVWLSDIGQVDIYPDINGRIIG